MTEQSVRARIKRLTPDDVDESTPVEVLTFIVDGEANDGEQLALRDAAAAELDRRAAAGTNGGVPDVLEGGDPLIAALTKAQAEFPTIDKTQTATVRGKNNTEYSYSYADLGDVLAKVRPVLARNGLAIVQRTQPLADGGKTLLITELLHVSGRTLRSEVELVVDTGIPQQFGGSLTYLRRYELVTLLGIAAEEDRDAQDVEPTRRNSGANGHGTRPAPLPEYALDTTEERRAELMTAMLELGLEREPAAKLVKHALDKWSAVPNGVVIFAKWLAASTPDAIAKREADAAAVAAEAPDPPALEELSPEEVERREAKAQAEAGDPPEPAAPASVDDPDLEGANLADPNDRDRVERLYRNLGCPCREPLAKLDLDAGRLPDGLPDGALEERCPLKSHGIPF